LQARKIGVSPTPVWVTACFSDPQLYEDSQEMVGYLAQHLWQDLPGGHSLASGPWPWTLTGRRWPSWPTGYSASTASWLKAGGRLRRGWPESIERWRRTREVAPTLPSSVI